MRRKPCHCHLKSGQREQVSYNTKEAVTTLNVLSVILTRLTARLTFEN